MKKKIASLDELWAPKVPKAWEAKPATRKHLLRDDLSEPHLHGDNRKPLTRGMVSTLSGDHLYRAVGSGLPRFIYKLDDEK